MRAMMIALGLFLPGSAWGQEMSREEIKRSLDAQVTEQVPEQQSRPGVRIGRTRSLGGEQPAPVAVPRSLSFSQIQFSFDSAELTASSFPTLNALAHGLADAMADPRFKGFVFPIIGYTDARGSDEYNLLLSQQRSEAVVRYLVGRGIPASRLMPIGRGERDLIDPGQPEAAINRRVEVRAKL